MKRQKMNRRKSAKFFVKTANKTKKVNNVLTQRGGIRL